MAGKHRKQYSRRVQIYALQRQRLMLEQQLLFLMHQVASNTDYHAELKKLHDLAVHDPASNGRYHPIGW